MKIQIKNRFTDKIIIEGEAKNIKEFLEKNKEADLWGADLREADLREADLREADLRKADLWEANLWGADLRKADLREADLWGAKIKITQQEDIIKSLGVVIK